MPSWVWIQEVVFPLVGFAMGAFAMYGVYRTVNRALERRHELRLQGGTGGMPDQLQVLEERVAELEAHLGRVAELEERLDFAERVLAKEGRGPLLGDH